MGVSEILASVDREIALLKQVRALLSGTSAVAAKKKAGRSKKAAVAVSPAVPKPAKKIARKKKRNLSPEGRKRIAEAVKRRWEAQRKAAASSK
jgi:predicted nucleotide-binding protein (sugar kinase/HSP70/actin superfamily)